MTVENVKFMLCSFDCGGEKFMAYLGFCPSLQLLSRKIEWLAKEEVRHPHFYRMK